MSRFRYTTFVRVVDLHCWREVPACYRDESVRLTTERLAHILTHPELEGFEPALEETLARPEWVIESIRDSAARLYDREYANTRVGRKLLCVVVKVRGNDRFVVTANRGRGIFARPPATG